jgi:hypothetical protein
MACPFFLDLRMLRLNGGSRTLVQKNYLYNRAGPNLHALYLMQGELDNDQNKEGGK